MSRQTYDTTQDRLPWPFIAAVSIIAIALALGELRNSLVGVWADDAYYINLAESFVRGLAMHRLDLPGAPAEWLVPPGYPLLIAPLWAIRHSGFGLMQLLSLAFHVLAIPLTYTLARIWLRPAWAAVVTAAYAWHFLALHFAVQVMTEAVLVSVALATLIVIDRQHVDDRVDKPSHAWAELVLPALAFVLHASAMTLIAAVSLNAALRRQWVVAVVGAAAAVLAVAWLLWLAPALSASDAVSYGVARETMMKSPENVPGGPPERALRYAVTFSPGLVVPGLTGDSIKTKLSAIGLGPLQLVMQLSVLALIALGWFVTLKQRLRLSHIWVVLLGALLAAHPFIGQRYLLPVLPLALIFTVCGSLAVADATRSQLAWAQRPLMVVGTIAVALWFVLDGYQVWRAIAIPTVSRVPDPRAALGWVKDHVTPDEPIMYDYTRTGYLYGRHAVVETPSETIGAQTDPIRFACSRGVRTIVVAPEMVFDHPPHWKPWVDTTLVPALDRSTAARLAFEADEGLQRVYTLGPTACLDQSSMTDQEKKK